MKILLDENIDVNFKHEFMDYKMDTVKDNGWRGIENGELTLDSNLRYQQTSRNIKFSY